MSMPDFPSMDCEALKAWLDAHHAGDEGWDAAMFEYTSRCGEYHSGGTIPPRPPGGP